MPAVFKLSKLCLFSALRSTTEATFTGYCPMISQCIEVSHIISLSDKHTEIMKHRYCCGKISLTRCAPSFWRWFVEELLSLFFVPSKVSILHLLFYFMLLNSARRLRERLARVWAKIFFKLPGVDRFAVATAMSRNPFVLWVICCNLLARPVILWWERRTLSFSRRISIWH